MNIANILGDDTITGGTTFKSTTSRDGSVWKDVTAEGVVSNLVTDKFENLKNSKVSWTVPQENSGFYYFCLEWATKIAPTYPIRTLVSLVNTLGAEDEVTLELSSPNFKGTGIILE